MELSLALNWGWLWKHIVSRHMTPSHGRGYMLPAQFVCQQGSGKTTDPFSVTLIWWVYHGPRMDQILFGADHNLRLNAENIFHLVGYTVMLWFLIFGKRQNLKTEPCWWQKNKKYEKTNYFVFWNQNISLNCDKPENYTLRPNLACSSCAMRVNWLLAGSLKPKIQLRVRSISSSDSHPGTRNSAIIQKLLMTHTVLWLSLGLQIISANK